jgi:hypothetical protein
MERILAILYPHVCNIESEEKHREQRISHLCNYTETEFALTDFAKCYSAQSNFYVILHAIWTCICHVTKIF